MAQNIITPTEFAKIVAFFAESTGDEVNAEAMAEAAINQHDFSAGLTLEISGAKTISAMPETYTIDENRVRWNMPLPNGMGTANNSNKG